MVGTFSGQVTREGVTTHHEDVPLDEIMPEEYFLETVCRAATGG